MSKSMRDMISPERLAKGMYWERILKLVQGCTPVSDGCDHCFLATQTHIRSFQKNKKTHAANTGLVTDGKFNGTVRFNHDLLGLPRKTKKPAVWFVWSDLYHEAVTDEQRRAFYSVASGLWCDDIEHIFLVLTKRADRMADFFTRKDGYAFSDPLPNVWHGATVEGDKYIDRVSDLLRVPGKLFLSVEPMLSGIELSKSPYFASGIDWVICGGESGPGARPLHPDWVRSLRDQCAAAGVPFFFKQWGEWRPLVMVDDTVRPLPNIVDGSNEMTRIGKTKAGRTLDGVIHSGMPGTK